MEPLVAQAATLEAAADKIADRLLKQAREVRAAGKVIARILHRANEGHEPSEKKDGPKWDAAMKVLEAAGLQAPNPGYLSWKD